MNPSNAIPSPKRTLRAAVACALSLLPALAAAQPAVPQAPTGGSVELALGRGSRLWLEGESTLHPYKAEASGFQVHVTLAPPSGGPGDVSADLAALARSGRLQRLEVVVPVTGLRSGEGGLDKNLWQALKSGEHPSIRFRMDSYHLEPSDGSAPPSSARIQGHLSIAGTEKPVELEVHLIRDSQGLRLIGSKDVLMTDYGVAPPVLMMGALKTANKVTVRFDLRPLPLP